MPRRRSQLINRGGEKISPIELDSAILALDGVAEAVCFGVEDAKYGEKVWAAVVPKDKGDVGEKRAREFEARLKKALEGKVAKVRREADNMEMRTKAGLMSASR